jgi:phosphatidylglycerophosphate synthase
MNTAARHERHQQSLLARPERVLLAALADHMPRKVNPDHLTGLGTVGILLAACAYAAAPWDPRCLFLVVPGLGLHWFGDSLDGTLARTRGCSRPRYGYYLDHVLDTAGAILLVGGMAFSGLMTPTVGLVLLVAYLAVSAETYLAAHAIGVFRMSYAGFGPTELRILIAAGTLVAYVDPVVSLGGAGTFLLFDVGSVVAIFALAVTFAFATISRSRKLYRAEPLPAPSPGGAR